MNKLVPQSITIAGKDVVAGLTICVHIQSSVWYDIRMKLGIAMIKLGAWIAGMGFEEAR